MKKLLGVSIAAMLAVSPMMANAALGTAGSNKVNWSNGNTYAQSSTAPTIQQASTNIATTTYVQGAYDALATGHNALDVRVGTLESSAQTDGSILHAVKNYAENGTYTPDTNTKNLTGVSDLNTAIDTLDTKVGNVGTNLTSNKGVLTNSANRADLVTAIVAINNQLADSGTDSSVEDGNFIQDTNTVSQNLTALDTAAGQNSAAITAILGSEIPLYGTWNSGDSTGSIAISALQSGTAVAPATVPAQSGGSGSGGSGSGGSGSGGSGSGE